MASLLTKLRSAQKSGSDLSKQLKFNESRPLSLDDAQDLCDFLKEQLDIRPLVTSDNPYHTPLYHLVMPFQSANEEEVREYLRDHGLPELARLCDLALAHPDTPGHPFSMIAKMFALFAYGPGVERIAQIVRRFPDEYFTSVAFQTFGDERHPDGAALIDALRDPLPTGFACVLTLDLANTLSRQQRLAEHPFDSDSGHRQLEAWLTDSDPGHFSYAVSAAASLPFLQDEARNLLAPIALDHVDPGVQMEAAWAMAYRGSEAGLKFLARMAADVRLSATARRYLEELGRADVIPAEASDPDFQALAEMSNWLAHPNEMGRPPTEITLYDTRELHWPPTNDSRRLWLVRYRYAPTDDNPKESTGVGLVGSITFCLFSESTADMPPEDVYALHCCWELEGNQDPRAPKKRSAAAGRKLLGI